MPSTRRRALFALLGFLFLASAVAAQKKQRLWPKALRKGDLIAFVAPAGPLDRTRMERAAGVLRARGYRIRAAKDLYRREGYLAGSDERRADELMKAFRDPKVAAIFPGTGGYGVMRILDRLDFDVIARNPKLVIGFSDITALHLALWARCRMVSLHSPVPMYGLGSKGGLHPEAARWFWKLSETPLKGLTLDYRFRDRRVPSPKALVKGSAKGVLLGGNLSLVSALVGTPYLPDFDGAILFLEDVGERPYRIDRMLAQMKLAGILDRLHGVVLGHFSDCNPSKGKASATLPELWQRYFAGLGIPVLTGFPSGHHRQNLTLPMGAPVVLDATRGLLKLAGR